MAATSIHIKPCKIGSAERHNRRLKELFNVRPELSYKNEFWQISQSLQERFNEIKALVKEKTGRKMQAKATPLHEGVVVIKNDTTMDELKELARRFQQRFGFETIQIAVHKDEGHFDENGTWKANLHAHMVFDWYNHSTGKSIKTTKADAREMQSICAEVLGMERGVASDKVHQDIAEFRVKAKLREAEEAERRAARALRDKQEAEEAQKAAAKKAEEVVKAAEGKKAAAEKAASEAQMKAAKAEARAVGGAIVKGAAALVGKFSEGKKIAAAKEEGRAEAMKEVLAGAGIKYNDMSKVTPSKIGRDLAAMGKDAEALRKENARLRNSANDGVTWRDNFIEKLLSIPIVKQCAQIIRYFVAHDLRHFEHSDIPTLSTALRGDESAASALIAAAKYGSSYNQPHLSDRWDRAERELQAIARGETLGENQERTQNLSRGWGR
jgi:hypothetical protein